MSAELEHWHYRGRVQGGVVVLETGANLPEGTDVTVVPSKPNDAVSPSESATTIWQKLAELGRKMESQPCDLPADLAANHDHYLHGLPKRQ